jgi:hypothetical protein
MLLISAEIWMKWQTESRYLAMAKNLKEWLDAITLL